MRARKRFAWHWRWPTALPPVLPTTDWVLFLPRCGVEIFGVFYTQTVGGNAMRAGEGKVVNTTSGVLATATPSFTKPHSCVVMV